MKGKINIAIVTPTIEMAYDYLKKLLQEEYDSEKENETTHMIYEANLFCVFWVEEFVVPIRQRRYNMIYCRPNVLNSRWFDYYLSPCGTRGFDLIEENS